MFKPNYADLMAITPNVFTGTAHAICAGFALLFMLVPGVGSKVAEAINKFADQYAKDSDKRKNAWYQLASEIRTRDSEFQAIAAERRAIAAKTRAEAAIKAAAKKSEASQTKSQADVAANKSYLEARTVRNIANSQMSADSEVGKKAEKAEKQVVKAVQAIEVESIEQIMKNKMQLLQIQGHYEQIQREAAKQETQISKLGTHLKTMADIEKAIATAAGVAKNAASENMESSQEAKIAVEALTVVEKELHNAHQAFYEVLNQHQQESNKAQVGDIKQSNRLSQTTEEGIGAVKKENTLAEAYLNLYKTELNAATKLDLTIAEAQSNTRINEEEKEKIAQILPEQLKARKAYLSVSLEQKLAKLDQTVLNTLHEQVASQIKQVASEINETKKLMKSDPEQLKNYETKRDALTQLSKQIDTIRSSKADPSEQILTQ